MTAAAGSPLFIVGHAIWFSGWIAINVTSGRPFDPYPFRFLTLVVSLEAIILSAAVLMTQNRMQRQADKRAHLDLQVNLLAEQELTTMLKMLTAICQRVGVTVAGARRPVNQLVKDADIPTIAVALDRKLARTLLRLRQRQHRIRRRRIAHEVAGVRRGSRCLFSDAANQAPAGSWCAASHASPRATCGVARGAGFSPASAGLKACAHPSATDSSAKVTSPVA